MARRRWHFTGKHTQVCRSSQPSSISIIDLALQVKHAIDATGRQHPWWKPVRYQLLDVRGMRESATGLVDQPAIRSPTDTHRDYVAMDASQRFNAWNAVRVQRTDHCATNPLLSRGRNGFVNAMAPVYFDTRVIDTPSKCGRFTVVTQVHDRRDLLHF